MNLYVIQAPSRAEDRLVRAAARRLPEHTFLCPRREIKIRRRGKTTKEVRTLFPGYIFLEAEEIDGRLFREVRRLPGFIRFLEDNTRIVPLSGEDLDLIRRLLAFGEVVRESKVTFDENKRIVVISGPLEGMEGRIVRVDRRKGRAKVRLDLYAESFLVDLGFELINKTAEKSVTPAGKGAAPLDGDTATTHGGGRSPKRT